MVILSWCLSQPGTDRSPGEIKTSGFHHMIAKSLVFCDKNFMPLCEGGPKNEERKRGTFLKRRYSTAIGSSNVKMVANRHRHAGDELLRNVNIDDFNWPWTFKIGGFSKYFRDFGLQHAFQEWIALKWLEIDQYYLHMKFLALNVDFSNSSLEPLGWKKPAHVDVKKGFPF